MHNCNATRNDLVELAINQSDQNQLPPAEFVTCSTCREEFAALRNASRATKAAIHLAQPAESFWYGYHDRLADRLARDSRHSNGWLAPNRPDWALWLRRLATASIPVPVPVVAGLFVFIALSIFFMMHSRQSSGAGPILTPPSVITKTIEVPVVHERLVTRVVYRKIQAPPLTLLTRARDEASTVESEQSEPPVFVNGLAGFQPANEAKVTIIKGSYQDEK